MVTHRKKKVTKYRGHTTHGCGSRKKRRGAGSRGGRGRAGTGKRAGQKKAGMAPQLGKLRQGGFFRQGSEKVNRKVINVGELTEDRINKWTAEGKVTREGHHYNLDLAKLGYGKLLGQGQTHLKLKITVERFAASAEEKIKAAGGEIVSDGKPEQSPDSQ